MNTELLGSLVIKFERWEGTPMVSVYTTKDEYIGSLDMMTMGLLEKRMIIPEIAQPGHKVCSIGKSLKDDKWYGWSHRAIHGFQIGDEVKEGDCCATPGSIDSYIAEHPEANKSLPVGFIAKTEADCKRMAIAFADSVS